MGPFGYLGAHRTLRCCLQTSLFSAVGLLWGRRPSGQAGRHARSWCRYANDLAEEPQGQRVEGEVLTGRKQVPWDQAGGEVGDKGCSDRGEIRKRVVVSPP